MDATKKIFITGGHLTPATAVIDLLLLKNWQVYFIGRKRAQEEDRSLSVELEIISSYGNKITLLLITTGKLQRYLNLKTIISLLKIPLGFVQSIYWFSKYRPKIVLSFGGYLALPVCLVAKIFGVPIITHEQTRTTGLANRIINLVADKICLSWPDQNLNLSTKNIYTGLPLRRSIFEIKDPLPINTKKPVFYISGGSLGSHKINSLISSGIAKLVKHFSIIHQCGNTKKYRDYQKLQEIRENLPKEDQDSYLPLKYVFPKQIGWLYKNISFVVGRSGANTVYELAALGIPALFIPLPFASGNEQEMNARFFQENGAGKIIKETDLTAEKLYKEIIEFNQKANKYKINAQELKQKIVLNGTDNLINVIESLIEPHN